jgi:hypothetical protein
MIDAEEDLNVTMRSAQTDPFGTAVSRSAYLEWAPPEQPYTCTILARNTAATSPYVFISRFDVRGSIPVNSDANAVIAEAFTRCGEFLIRLRGRSTVLTADYTQLNKVAIFPAVPTFIAVDGSARPSDLRLTQERLWTALKTLGWVAAEHTRGHIEYSVTGRSIVQDQDDG